MLIIIYLSPQFIGYLLMCFIVAIVAIDHMLEKYAIQEAIEEAYQEWIRSRDSPIPSDDDEEQK